MTPRIAFLCTLLACLVVVGCGDDDASPPPPPPIDTGSPPDTTPSDSGVDSNMDAPDPMDGDVGDAGDADVPDVMLDTSVGDGGERDTGLVFPDDTGLSDDVSTDVEGVDACSTVLDGIVCPDLPETCGPGLTCVDDGCGGRVCIPSSHRCSTAEDCPAGSMCMEVEPGAEPTCIRGSGCGDSRDCAFGFACEAGACVDRRVGCDAPPATCPQGYVCMDTSDFGTDLTCVPAHYKCDTDVACDGVPLFSICADVDGDGNNECVSETGSCTTSEMCGDLTCIYDTRFGGMNCSSSGLCADATDCGAGYSCVDLWGDGLKQCVEAGSCSSTADCPAPQICAVPFGETTPRCWGEGI